MIEIILGIAAIVLAVIAIAEVKSSTEELKEDIKALSEATASDKKTIETIRNALYNKKPEVEEVEDIYRQIKLEPGLREKIEGLKKKADLALYKDQDVDQYFKIMFEIAQKAYRKEIPNEYANQRIKDLLISLSYKIRGMKGMGEISEGSKYVPKRGD
jgi:predicted  nucleic acid-binding Zn-ribbon protein